jgi:hypothetical protein
MSTNDQAKANRVKTQVAVALTLTKPWKNAMEVHNVRLAASTDDTGELTGELERSVQEHSKQGSSQTGLAGEGGAQTGGHIKDHSDDKVQGVTSTPL